MMDYHQPESGTHTQVIIGGIRAWANYPDTVFGLFMWEDWHLEPQIIHGSQSLNYHLYNESSAGHPGYIFVTISGNSNWDDASTHQGIFCWSDWNDAASKNHTSSQLLNYHLYNETAAGMQGYIYVEVGGIISSTPINRDGIFGWSDWNDKPAHHSCSLSDYYTELSLCSF